MKYRKKLIEESGHAFVDLESYQQLEQKLAVAVELIGVLTEYIHDEGETDSLCDLASKTLTQLRSDTMNKSEFKDKAQSNVDNGGK